MIVKIICIVILQNSIFDLRFIIISQIIIVLLLLLKRWISFVELSILCITWFLLLLLLSLLLLLFRLIYFNLRKLLNDFFNINIFRLFNYFLFTLWSCIFLYLKKLLNPIPNQLPTIKEATIVKKSLL
jgi:hypothetical protein